MMTDVQTSTRMLSILCQLFSSRMAALLEPHGLTPAQFGILNHIARPDLREGTRVSDIAKAVEVRQPAVTKTIAKFEEAGLVRLTPSAHDARAKLINITPEGGAHLIEVQKSIGPNLAGLFADIPAEDLAQFNRTAGKLIGWLDTNRL